MTAEMNAPPFFPSIQMFTLCSMEVTVLGTVSDTETGPCLAGA